MVGSVPVSTKRLPATPLTVLSRTRRVPRFDARGQQGSDHLPIVRLAEETAADARGDNRPDIGDPLQGILDSPASMIASMPPEMLREVTRRRLADVADAERVNKARQRRALAPFDGGNELAADFSAMRSSSSSRAASSP